MLPGRLLAADGPATTAWAVGGERRVMQMEERRAVGRHARQSIGQPSSPISDNASKPPPPRDE
jgi:hypothetical protein